MITMSIVYDHRQRTKKGEDGPIEIRVTVNHKPYYINTGVRVPAHRFVAGTIRDDKDSSNADVLNERLRVMTHLVELEVNKCMEERRPIDVTDIRRRVGDIDVESSNDDQEHTLVNWIKEQIPMLNVSKATKQKYSALCNRLTMFGKLTRWEQLNTEVIYNFDAWLHQQERPLTQTEKENGREPQKIGDAGVDSYHKSLRAMINRAMKMGKINANPYDRLRGEFRCKKNEIINYLTEDEMQKILDITPVPGSQVDMARDLFIFQMYTGLAYSDTQRFDATKYKKVNGKWKYVGERVKSGVPYVSMLLPPVVDVLEKYDWHVPKMNNQRYNQMLKAIGMVIGVERLHSHMGRHTFGTWMLANGAKIENVSRMMGHTNITQTQRYAKVQAKEVYDDYDKAAEKLEKKKKG
jgi:integrase